MFSLPTIQDSLFGLVGIRQPYNPEYAIIDVDNQKSSSGHYANDNPLAKVEFVIDNIDYEDATALQINDYLKKVQETSIVNVMSNVFDEVDFISRGFVYKNPILKKNIEYLGSDFVGYKIQRHGDSNVAFNIPRIFANFKGLGTIKILLFNADKDEPIYTKEVSIISTNQVIDLDWIVNDGGVQYYIGYLTDGLTVEPFARDYDNSSVKTKFQFHEIEPIKVVGHNTEVLFPIDTTTSVSQSWGINIEILEYYDYTELIIANKNMFANAIRMQFTINLIQSYVASLRSNKNQRLSQEDLYKAIAEVDGISGENAAIKKVGLKSLLLSEVSNLKKEINRLKKGAFGDKIKVYTLC